MKTKYLYKLVNTNGEVEFVGLTTRPERRMYELTVRKPTQVGFGLFYRRTDLEMVICGEFTDTTKAYWAEVRLKQDYGLDQDKHKQTHGFIKTGKSMRHLTLEQAREIRSKYVPHKYTVNQLADEYGVKWGVIWGIIKNEGYLIK